MSSPVVVVPTTDYITYLALRDRFAQACQDMRKTGFSANVDVDVKNLLKAVAIKKKKKKPKKVIEETISGKVTKPDKKKKKKAKFVGSPEKC